MFNLNNVSKSLTILFLNIKIPTLSSLHLACEIVMLRFLKKHV